MTVNSSLVDPSAMSESHIAVRVSSVSKIYRLWNSPRARLAYPIKRLLNAVLPQFLRNEEVVTKNFHEFHALEDISFEIRKGESWGFIGVNGSGKSALLKIISGNLRPSSGSVEVMGKTAILEFASGLNGEFTGRENIFHRATLLGLSPSQLSERLDSIITFADIGEFIDQPVKTYSSGMTARLGFAIVAHVDSDILISDEALAVGDAFYVQKSMRFIRNFLKRGTFIFVSHSINDVMSLCDKAVWLSHGKAVMIGLASDVCQAYADAASRSKSSIENSPRTVGLASSKSHLSYSASVDEKTTIPTNSHGSIGRILYSSEELAELRDHFCSKTVRPVNEFLAESYFVSGPDLDHKKVGNEVASGGATIFSVEITDENGAGLRAIRGGEVVSLTIRAAATKRVTCPVVGFQLKNYMGLALIGENTNLSLSNHISPLEPEEILSVTFRFSMPLLASGEYIVLVAIQDIGQDKPEMLDIIHEALLIRCITKGARHGFVGVPLLGLDISRDNSPLES